MWTVIRQHIRSWLRKRFPSLYKYSTDIDYIKYIAIERENLQLEEKIFRERLDSHIGKIEFDELNRIRRRLKRLEQEYEDFKQRRREQE